jgi:DNA-binding GntR family transcriptional regulator
MFRLRRIRGTALPHGAARWNPSRVLSGMRNAHTGGEDAMNCYSQRRAMIERELRSPDVPTLSNNEISRLLGVGVVTVRRVRRDLEARGAIPKVLWRLARHGNFVDVARLIEPPSMKAK